MGQKYQTKVCERVSYSVRTNKQGRHEKMGVGLTLNPGSGPIPTASRSPRMAANVLCFYFLGERVSARVWMARNEVAVWTWSLCRCGNYRKASTSNIDSGIQGRARLSYPGSTCGVTGFEFEGNNSSHMCDVSLCFHVDHGNSPERHTPAHPWRDQWCLASGVDVSRLCLIRLSFGPSFFPQCRDFIHRDHLERPHEPVFTRPHARGLHIVQQFIHSSRLWPP